MIRGKDKEKIGRRLGKTNHKRILVTALEVLRKDIKLFIQDIRRLIIVLADYYAVIIKLARLKG